MITVGLVFFSVEASEGFQIIQSVDCPRPLAKAMTKNVAATVLAFLLQPFGIGWHQRDISESDVLRPNRLMAKGHGFTT